MLAILVVTAVAAASYHCISKGVSPKALAARITLYAKIVLIWLDLW